MCSALQTALRASPECQLPVDLAQDLMSISPPARRSISAPLDASYHLFTSPPTVIVDLTDLLGYYNPIRLVMSASRVSFCNYSSVSSIFSYVFPGPLHYQTTYPSCPWPFNFSLLVDSCIYFTRTAACTSLHHHGRQRLGNRCLHSARCKVETSLHEHRLTAAFRHFPTYTHGPAFVSISVELWISPILLTIQYVSPR